MNVSNPAHHLKTGAKMAANPPIQAKQAQRDPLVETLLHQVDQGERLLYQLICLNREGNLEAVKDILDRIESRVTNVQQARASRVPEEPMFESRLVEEGLALH
jgi:hypothetical protein